MKIQESAENYLETILILQGKKVAVRSIDIVNELGYSKPSVSIAMKNLRENGYIEMTQRVILPLRIRAEKLPKECMNVTHLFLSGSQT